ncbi:MAG: OmpH family outer membrane protein [Phycisphaerae bacterium]
MFNTSSCQLRLASRAPFAAVVVLSLSVTTTLAQESPSKVACIDVVKIFNDYQLQRDLSTMLQQKQSELQAEAQSRQSKTDSLQATIEALDPKDPIYRDRLQELLRMQIDNKVWFETAQAAITRELAVWSNDIYQDIVNTVGQIATERGIEMVFYRDEYEPAPDPELVKERIRRRKLVWSSPNSDLSGAVLQRMNAAYSAKGQKPQLRIP